MASQRTPAISALVPSDNGNGDGMDRRSSGEHAALYIRQLIFDGRLVPGARVPQDEIAERLGISRIPLREALISLEREGWIRVEIHRGAFVAALDARSVQDHFEVLGQLYVFAIERAVQRSDLTYVDDLQATHDELEGKDLAHEAGPLLMRHYSTLVDAAQSPRLRVILRAISSLVPGDFFSAVPEAVELERRSWQRIIHALRRRDAERATGEFLRMMRRVSNEVVRLCAERGLFETVETVETVEAG